MARAFPTLLRFHAGAGLRVGLRANAIVLGIVVFAFGSSPEPLASVEQFIRGVVSIAPETGPRLTFAAIAAALAGIAAPRVTLGATAWMRSLPISGRTTRVVTALTLTGAQIAVLIFLPIAAVIAARFYHAPVSAGRLVAMVVLVLAVATAFVPSPWMSRALAVGAGVAAILSTLTSVAAAVILIAIASALPGEAPSRGRRIVGGGAGIRRVGRSHARGAAMWRRIVWRGMGFRRAIGCAIIPLLICAYGSFIVTNNVDLRSAESNGVVRWCGGIALAFLAASLANIVLISRQPWPWVRSLPWSSARRVLADASLLGAFLIVIPVVLLPLAIVPALAVAAIVPLASLLGASAIRAGGGRQSGAAGETLAFAGAAAVAVAIWPVTALIALTAAPLAFRWAVARERRTSVTRWLELHHEAASDPLWGANG